MKIIDKVVNIPGFPAIIKLCSIVLYTISETLKAFFTSKVKEDMLNPEKMSIEKNLP
jgi:hypothetical protein